MLVRYALEAVEVRGNSRTRSRVVLRYIPFKPGDIIDVDDPEVELTRYRLLGTGFFRDVQFSLRKGSERGRVVLVVDVVERNTIVVNDLWMGLSRDADTEGASRPLTAYGGLDVAETNLAGTGITLGGAIAVADEQLALRVRFLDPAFLGGRWMTSGSLLFNNAKDFFGNSDVIKVDPERDRGGQRARRRALHALRRHPRRRAATCRSRLSSGSTTGSRRSTPRPRCAASHLRAGFPGADRVRHHSAAAACSRPRGSRCSTTPAISRFCPRAAGHLSITGEVGLPFGSDYVYQRLDIDTSRWWQLPYADHVLRLQLFGGAIDGDAPFFEQFYVNDFSDFRPGRVLGINFDRRPPPNFLDTAIVEVRYGALRGQGRRRVPHPALPRPALGLRHRFLRFERALRGRRAARSHPSAARLQRRRAIPIDLTANLGFRMDTSAGGFVFAFANAIGLLAGRRRG